MLTGHEVSTSWRAVLLRQRWFDFYPADASSPAWSAIALTIPQSNTNVERQLAAVALVRATGTPLAELLQSLVAAPLGLRRTTLAPDDSTSRRCGVTPSTRSMAPMKDSDPFCAQGSVEETLCAKRGVPVLSPHPAELKLDDQDRWIGRERTLRNGLPIDAGG